MKVQLNPGTRLQYGDGVCSEYGAVVDVADDIGRQLVSGPNPSGIDVTESVAEKPATRKKEK